MPKMNAKHARTLDYKNWRIRYCDPRMIPCIDTVSMHGIILWITVSYSPMCLAVRSCPTSPAIPCNHR